jgi:hypothetical protein
MKPGEPGRTLLEEREKAKAVEVRMATPAKQVVKERTPQVGIRAAQSGGKRFFDLSKIYFVSSCNSSFYF